MRATIASRTSSTPRPLFALMSSASLAGIARTVSICSLTNFVNDRENSEVVASGEESVRDRLRFNALAGVDDEQRAFASGEGAGDFVRKIDVTGGVDQIEAVGVSVFGFIVQANALGFDGDAALALQVHGVEYLLVHFSGAERAGHFEQAVGERGFAVVDVRNNAKIAYELWIHLGL
jgi:hypothetical protein